MIEEDPEPPERSGTERRRPAPRDRRHRASVRRRHPARAGRRPTRVRRARRRGGPRPRSGSRPRPSRPSAVVAGDRTGGGDRLADDRVRGRTHERHRPAFEQEATGLPREVAEVLATVAQRHGGGVPPHDVAAEAARPILDDEPEGDLDRWVAGRPLRIGVLVEDVAFGGASVIRVLHGNRCGTRHVEVPWGDQSHTTHPSIDRHGAADRLRALALGTVIAVAFTACAGEGDQDSSSADATEQTEAPADIGDDEPDRRSRRRNARRHGPSRGGGRRASGQRRHRRLRPDHPWSRHRDRDAGDDDERGSPAHGAGDHAVGVGARRCGVRLRHRLRRRGSATTDGRAPTRRHGPAERR